MRPLCIELQLKYWDIIAGAVGTVEDVNPVNRSRILISSSGSECGYLRIEDSRDEDMPKLQLLEAKVNASNYPAFAFFIIHTYRMLLRCSNQVRETLIPRWRSRIPPH